jgi:hypothetical protein
MFRLTHEASAFLEVEALFVPYDPDIRAIHFLLNHNSPSQKLSNLFARQSESARSRILWDRYAKSFIVVSKH